MDPDGRVQPVCLVIEVVSTDESLVLCSSNLIPLGLQMWCLSCETRAGGDQTHRPHTWVPECWASHQNGWRAYSWMLFQSS